MCVMKLTKGGVFVEQGANIYKKNAGWICERAAKPLLLLYS